MTSRLWWRVHQWVGFKLSLFTSFIVLTGTLAVVSHEIDWLLQPSLRVAPTSVAGEPTWARIAHNAARHPGVASLEYMSAPTARAFAVRISYRSDDGSRGFLHVHPTTGVIQGRAGFVDAQRVLRNLHRHLNLPNRIGIPIVASLSILLLISFATSFVIYKKWWRGFFRPVRVGNARRAWGDLHRLIGVWSLWFVLLIALTGLWYLVEQLGGDAPALPVAKHEAGEVRKLELGVRLAAALATARAADPDLRIKGIRFPSDGSGAFVFEGQRSAWLVRPRANAAWVDAQNGKILLIADAATLNVHQRISEAADPLHFGTFGGYWTKLTWFIFGLALTALSVSGVAIYALRIGRDLQSSRLFPIDWCSAWRGMGRWGWAAAGLVALGFVMMPRLFSAASG
jgi:uncharacterized iron-regulated membrane protein